MRFAQTLLKRPNKLPLALTSCLIALLVVLGAHVSTVGQQTQADEEQANHAAGSQYSVNVTSCIPVNSDRTLNRISYEYFFQKRDFVSISGLGTVPASGKFTYITSDKQLLFTDTTTRAPIVTVRLVETALSMSGGSIELPDNTLFMAEPFRSGEWNPESTFAAATTATLQQYFPLGYDVRDVGPEHYYLSTYRSLDLTNRQLVGQVALAISHPYDWKGQQITYRVQVVVRDRPRLSSAFHYGKDVNPESTAAAQAFLDKFLSELQKNEKRP
jgi:hypothetical protein